MSKDPYQQLAERFAHEALVWEDEGHARDNSYHVGIGNGIKWCAKELARLVKRERRSGRRNIPVE